MASVVSVKRLFPFPVARSRIGEPIKIVPLWSPATLLECFGSVITELSDHEAQRLAWRRESSSVLSSLMSLLFTFVSCRRNHG